MESTKVLKSSHLLLTPSLSIGCDHHDEQTNSSLDDFRRTDSADCLSPTLDESSAADLSRRVSVSRSGRYKSKARQRMSLFTNSLDFSNNAVVLFTDDSLTRSDVTAKSVDEHSQPVQRKEVSPPQTEVVTSTADASTVEDIAAAESVKSSTDVGSEESSKPRDESCLPAPSDTCLELVVAEVDESTDLWAVCVVPWLWCNPAMFLERSRPLPGPPNHRISRNFLQIWMFLPNM